MANIPAVEVVVVIGDGGREDALASVLRRVEGVNVQRLPSSASLEQLMAATSPDQDHLYLVGPEQPLCDGLADRLAKEGRLVLGPTQAGARLEGSKSYMKWVLERSGVPTARSWLATHPLSAEEALEQMSPPYVIKTDGLAGGKGVTIANTIEEARADIQDKLSGAAFGEAGQRVVIEEFLEGEELSLIVLCDGKRAIPLPLSRDHKRLCDGDRGPNTGGMGAFAPVPGVPPIEELMELPHKVLEALQVDDYRGFMYLGLMLSPDGPKVLEINIRLGDPEAQVILPLVEPNSLLWCLAEAARGKLESELEILPGAAVTITLAAAGYPESPRKGDPIRGIGPAEQTGAQVFLGGVQAQEDGSELLTNGGRVLYVTGLADTLEGAHMVAYEGADRIYFRGMQFRQDIAATALRH